MLSFLSVQILFSESEFILRKKPGFYSPAPCLYIPCPWLPCSILQVEERVLLGRISSFSWVQETKFGPFKSKQLWFQTMALAQGSGDHP